MKQKLFECVGGNYFRLHQEVTEPPITNFKIKDLGIRRLNPSKRRIAQQHAAQEGMQLAIGIGTNAEDAAADALDQIEGGGTENIEKALDEFQFRDDLTTSQTSAEYGGDLDVNSIGYIIYIYYKPTVEEPEPEDSWDPGPDLDNDETGVTYQSDYEDRFGGRPEFRQ